MPSRQPADDTGRPPPSAAPPLPRLTLRQLRYFVEIARSRSFSRAAEQMAVAQPALSQNIATLEAELGARLFERHAKGVDLSPAGHRLYQRATELLGGFDALKEQVAGRDARPAGRVRLCLDASLAGVLIAPTLRAIETRYPGIELAISYGLSFEARMQVESGRSDLALMPSAAELEGIASLPLFEERFQLYGAYAVMRKAPRQIPFAEVARRPLAAPDRAHDLRKVIERAASAAELALDVRYELNSAALLLGVVKEGLAWTILPDSACTDAVAAKAVAGRPIVAPELSRVQALVWLQGRPLTPAALAVRDAVADLVSTLVREGRLRGRLIDTAHKKT